MNQWVYDGGPTKKKTGRGPGKHLVNMLDSERQKSHSGNRGATCFDRVLGIVASPPVPPLALSSFLFQFFFARLQVLLLQLLV